MEEEISLVELMQILLKRWKLLVFLPLLAAVLAYGISLYTYTPNYVASSALIVMPFTEEAEGGGVIRHDIDSTYQVVQSCKELTMRRDNLQQIIGELNLPYSVEELQENIEINVSRDVTEISATSADPERAYQIANQVTDVMMEQITVTARLDNVELLNPATVPEDPVNRQFGLNVAISFVLALMVSVALSFLFEHLDNTIKSAEDVQKHLGAQVLGVIPEFEEDEEKRQLSRDPAAANAAITVTNGRSAASEAYRTLRTNIQFMTLDHLAKTILIVGAHPECGKTTTVTNLAFAMAQAGSSVLIADTDLRRPTMHKVFGSKNFFGLTSLLIEENLNVTAARQKTQIPNLDIIPSGPAPPNPAELLASRKMHKTLKDFQSRYDFVVLDSPPMMNMADASILAQLADATILVVAYGETTREEAQKVQQQLELAKANFIGVVINGLPPHQDPYGYYGYYEEEKPPEKKGRKKKQKKKKKQEEEDFDIAFDPDEAYKDL